jgi:hypothetical protein
MKEKKADKERQMSYDSLPPSIKESLTEEEKHAFLYEKHWPDSLFDKLDEFIVKE